MSGCSCGRDPAEDVGGRFVGERVQVRCGWTDRTVGTVIAEDEIGLVLETAGTTRLYPWTAITSVRRARA